MWFHIDSDSGIPIYIQLKDQIRQAILNGILQADDPMPSIREVAAQLVVNPNTIARAFQELERDGYIKTQRGRGSFVAGNDHKSPPKEEQYDLFMKKIRVLQAEGLYMGIEWDEMNRLWLEAGKILSDQAAHLRKESSD